MSLYEYQESQRIAAKDYGFYALIMAAARKADSTNMRKLEMLWPEVIDELRRRYNAPGGKLRRDD